MTPSGSQPQNPRQRYRQRKRRQWIGWAVVLLLIPLAWFSCPGSSHQPAPEGLTVLMDVAPKGLDPRFATSDSSVKLARLIFSSLVTVDNLTGEPEPDLAASIDTISDTHYKIALRTDAYWHDGKPVTSEDVRFSFMELGRESIKSPYAGLSKRIARFEIHDDKNFSLHLTEVHAPFVSNLTLGIVPAHVMTKDGLFPKDILIGSGPFQFEARYKSSWLSMIPAPRYHGGAPPAERLVFRVIPDDNMRLLTLMSGGGHMAQNSVTPLLLPVLEEDPDLIIETSPSFKYTYLGINMTHPILKEMRVRQALAYGIDREAIIKHKFRGSAHLATGLLSPTHWAYHGDVDTYAQDLNKAKTLLDEAGYPDPDGDGPKMRFWITYKTTTNKFRRAIAEIISQQLSRIGVGVKVQAFEWGTFFGDIKSRNFDICSLQWPSVTEPDLYSWIFHSKSIPSAENRSAGANRGAYRNDTVDKLLDEGRLNTDPEQRKRIYAEVQRILATELPYISLWHEDNILVRNKRLQDYQVVPNARYRGLDKAHLK